MSRSPSPELQLVIACCRWPTGDEQAAAIRDLAPLVDPDEVLKLAHRHRVGMLVHNALREAAINLPGIGTPLADHARKVVQQNLQFAAESARIAATMRAAGLPFLFVKGVTLNILAYASLGMKQAADIDLLVLPENYEAAAAALSGLGYACNVPGPLPPGDIARWARHNKDSGWRRGFMVVELHQRLAANPQLLSAITAAGPQQQVTVAPGIVLPTLTDDDLFAYLAFHGAFSGWFRLKWIADLNALLAGRDEAALVALFRHADRIGAGRAAASALLLCRRLYGLVLSEAFEADLSRSRAARLLVRVALDAIAKGGAAEITDRRFGTAPIHASNLLLRPGIGFKLGDIRHKLARQAVNRQFRRAEPDRS